MSQVPFKSEFLQTTFLNAQLPHFIVIISDVTRVYFSQFQYMTFRLRAVPTNSKVFLPRFMIMQEM